MNVQAQVIEREVLYFLNWFQICLALSSVCFASSRSACKGSNRFRYLLNSLRPCSQQICYILLSVKGLNPGVISDEWIKVCATCYGDKILLQRQRFSRLSQKLSSTHEEKWRCNALCDEAWCCSYSRLTSTLGVIRSLRRVAATCCCNRQSSDLCIRTDLSPRRFAATWLSPRVHKYMHNHEH